MKRFRLNFFNLGLLLLASIGISMYLNKSIKEALTPMSDKALAKLLKRTECKGKRGRRGRKCVRDAISLIRKKEKEAARKKVVKKKKKNNCGPAVASIKKKFCDLKL